MVTPCPTRPLQVDSCISASVLQGHLKAWLVSLVASAKEWTAVARIFSAHCPFINGCTLHNSEGVAMPPIAISDRAMYCTAHFLGTACSPSHPASQHQGFARCLDILAYAAPLASTNIAASSLTRPGPGTVCMAMQLLPQRLPLPVLWSPLCAATALSSNSWCTFSSASFAAISGLGM